MIKASSVIHKKVKRIKVEFPNITEYSQLIRKIEDARWSVTLKSWHIPYSKEAFEQLKKYFPEIEIVKSEIAAVSPEIAVKPSEDKGRNSGTKSESKDVSITVAGRKIILKLPKNEIDIRFIKSLKYSRWDKSNFCWIVPNYPGNIELIKQFFGERISKLEISEEVTIESNTGKVRKIDKNEMLIVETNKGRLHIYFAYDKSVSKKVKDFPYCKWNKAEKCWSIPYSENYIGELQKFAEQNKIKFTLEKISSDLSGKKRLSRRGEDGFRNCPEDYIFKIRELQYSESTLKTYQNAFEEFINYYKDIELSEIDEKMILEFMRYLVMDRMVSESYQDQVINAIKFYYEKVLKRKRKIYLIDRPKKEKKLPTVFNEEEISLVIKKTENLKHKTILMLAYSSGLRLSEIVNLKIKDIDSKRMQIRVEHAKGKKDRYTILSARMLSMLREYFSRYKPGEWLFEGEKGGRYSARSIQKVATAAIKRAGIRKKASLHTFRHTFGTHLLENGTDLRYIQSLLGHESSKTTEIYTHITTKGFDQIKNPLDNLDI